MSKSKLKIEEEIDTWKYLASLLTQPHQKEVREEIWERVRELEKLLKEN